jgi:hypothetical protein
LNIDVRTRHRLNLAAPTFLGIDGIVLAAGFDVDKAERLVVDVATGTEESVDAIAAALQAFSES